MNPVARLDPRVRAESRSPCEQQRPEDPEDRHRRELPEDMPLVQPVPEPPGQIQGKGGEHPAQTHGGALVAVPRRHGHVLDSRLEDIQLNQHIGLKEVSRGQSVQRKLLQRAGVNGHKAVHGIKHIPIS